MLKLSDPVSPIPSKFQVPQSRCRAIAREFVRRTRYDAMVDAAADRREAARQFVLRAEGLVDSVLDPEAPMPPRFVRTAPVRFGRTRLFLSEFIGRIAWRGWVGL